MSPGQTLAAAAGMALLFKQASRLLALVRS